MMSVTSRDFALNNTTAETVESSTFLDQGVANVSVKCPHLVVNSTPPGYCSPFFDRILCWPAVRANTTAQHTCPFQTDTSLIVYRYCPSNASWENALSDYTSCLNIETTTTDPRDIKLAETLRDIYFILSAVSLVLLLITIFIFQYFRSLHCSRISIHKHLVVSFIFRFVANIVITEPYISGRKTSYRDLDWLCKTITALSQYCTLANVFWMFVEGFFLHHSLVLGVFSTQAPFKLFYFIGWGLPAMFTIAWAIVLYFTHDSKCWSDYSQLDIYYIITIPFISALVVNLVFLVNIIRVLVSKLRANNHIESANIRKAIKATVVLMPLLGITNLLFVMSPSEKSLKVAYHVTNAVLHSSQGIFVAILYCFLNGEVRRVLKQKWYRFRIRHGRHPSGRRRSSRTSSFFLSSGTEDDDLTEKPNPQTTEAEQLRLLQANLALRNETLENSKTSPETNHVVKNGNTNDTGTTQTFIKKNNNGVVHFDLGYTIERESVL